MKGTIHTRPRLDLDANGLASLEAAGEQVVLVAPVAPVVPVALADVAAVDVLELLVVPAKASSGIRLSSGSFPFPNL